MSKWATLYRPEKFSEVVGQEHVKQVLIPLIRDGKAAQRSYVFAGPSGTGKTTLARIVAMALLCETPLAEREAQVEPCGHCVSCRQIKSTGSHLGYMELDAANQGGKATIQEIVAGTAYSTMGASDRKLYCMDECHRLSADAMDALLKPLEDEIPNSGGDKRLLILFCTTELEKIRPALRARCLTFKLTSPETEDLVKRLAYLLDQEHIPYDAAALPLIVASGKGHVRDMVSNLEQVAQSGQVSIQAVRTLLDLDVEDIILQMLETFLTKEQDSEALIEKVLERVSPKQAYSLTISVLMQIWRNKSNYLDSSLLQRLSMAFAPFCLHFTGHLLNAPYIVTPEHYLCDMCFLKAYYLKEVSSLNSIQRSDLAPLVSSQSSLSGFSQEDLHRLVQEALASQPKDPSQLSAALSTPPSDAQKTVTYVSESVHKLKGADYDIEAGLVPSTLVNQRNRVLRGQQKEVVKPAEVQAQQQNLDHIRKKLRR